MIITEVGIFAAAGFKIIPCVNRIIFSLQGIKLTLVLETIQRIFSNPEKKDSSLLNKNLEKEIKFNYNLDFKDIYFKYPNSNKMF